MKKTLLHSSLLASLLFVVPVVGITAQIDTCTGPSCGLEVEDPEVVRYDVTVLSASDYLDEDLVADLLDSLGG